MIKFYKYVAAGNDFIIFNNWDAELELTQSQIINLCDRRFGIGADGVLILEPQTDASFRMNYFNADGSRGEMCGNGARALVAFAHSQKRVGTSGSFLADDGHHAFKISRELVDVEILVNDTLHNGEVPNTDCGFINTGVPHLVIPVRNVNAQDLDLLGNSMNGHSAHPQGTNVNIIEKQDNILQVRTWERGVNQETLACGTGAAASAIYANHIWSSPWPISLQFKGGDLEVDFYGNQYWLKGPAKLVFIGELSLSVLNSK